MRPVERVVSLLPSSTEIACALGFRDRLVGRSHECDFPRSVQSLPALTQPKLDVRRSSAEIDTDVRALVRERDSRSTAWTRSGCARSRPT